MPRSSYVLAALAAAAVPEIDVRSVRVVSAPAGCDAAVITDGDGHEWVVRAPSTVRAGVALEAEMTLLESLEIFREEGKVEFEVPHIAGWADLPEGGRVVVHKPLPGVPVDPGTLRPGPGPAAEIARTIASIHELPSGFIEAAGLPVYNAAECQQRHVSEIDEAAATGKVPAALLRRWEASLENVALWRFQPVPIHGDVAPENVLMRGGGVAAITGWGEARLADPAEDLAWLVASAPAEVTDTFLEAYQMRRSEMRDPHFAERIHLLGELALAQWLLYGVRSSQDDVVNEAVAMLEELSEAVADGG
ncbi:MAG: phosphotransferase [Cellulomonadaceae bacterium]|nr:phosphotransferase [Cellulomonadaceae bacterium]